MKRLYCKNCKWSNDNDYNSEISCTVGMKNPHFNEKFKNWKGEVCDGWKNKAEYNEECKKFNIFNPSEDQPILEIECCNFNIGYNCKYYKDKRWWKNFLIVLKYVIDNLRGKQ